MEAVCVGLTAMCLLACSILLYIIKRQSDVIVTLDERIEQLEYEMDNYILRTYPAVLSHLQERFVEAEWYEEANKISKIIDIIEEESPLYQNENTNKQP